MKDRRWHHADGKFDPEAEGRHYPRTTMGRLLLTGQFPMMLPSVERHYRHGRSLL